MDASCLQRIMVWRSQFNLFPSLHPTESHFPPQMLTGKLTSSGPYEYNTAHGQEICVLTCNVMPVAIGSVRQTSEPICNAVFCTNTTITGFKQSVKRHASLQMKFQYSDVQSCDKFVFV